MTAKASLLQHMSEVQPSSSGPELRVPGAGVRWYGAGDGGLGLNNLPCA